MGENGKEGHFSYSQDEISNKKEQQTDLEKWLTRRWSCFKEEASLGQDNMQNMVRLDDPKSFILHDYNECLIMLNIWSVLHLKQP